MTSGGHHPSPAQRRRGCSSTSTRLLQCARGPALLLSCLALAPSVAPLTSAFVAEANEPRAYSLLRASQGHGDGWLATEESFPVVLRARIEGRAAWLFAGGDLAGALMPTDPRYSRSSIWPSVDELVSVAQVGAWVGARPIEQLAIGARGQLVVQYGGLVWPEIGYGFPSLNGTSADGSRFVFVRSPFFHPYQLEAFVSLIAFVRGEIDDLTLEVGST